jgi:hypothetical protein
MKRLLSLLIIGLCILACDEGEQIVMDQFSIPMPSSVPSIDKSVLTAGGTFSVGYANGNIRSNRVALTWRRSEDADFFAYRITRGSLLLRTITNAQTNYIVDSNLVQDTYYQYTVAGLGQYGTHRSDSITIKTPRFQVPTLSLQVFADTSVRLAWTRSTESATGYRLERAAIAGTFEILASPTDVFYVDRNVQYGTQYTYRVAATSPYETTATSLQQSATVTFLMNEGFEAGAIPSAWTTGGVQPWVISTVTPFHGTYAARTGTLTHNQWSYIDRTVSFTGTRTISFRYRVSSEPTNDYLRFSINGVLSGQNWSGDTGWRLHSTTYTGAGTVSLHWEYVKNYTVSVGEDAAWIDNVIVQ